MFFYSEAAFGTVGEEIRGLADTTSSGDCDQVELCPSGPIVRWCRLVLSKCESLQIATKTRSDSLHWSSQNEKSNRSNSYGGEGWCREAWWTRAAGGFAHRCAFSPVSKRGSNGQKLWEGPVEWFPFCIDIFSENSIGCSCLNMFKMSSTGLDFYARNAGRRCREASVDCLRTPRGLFSL